MDLLHYIKTFVCLAENQTMAKTMDILLYSQPTISTHIANLEKYYSCSLLEFKNKQYFLTEEGTCLYNYGVQLLGLELETSKAMADFGNLERGTLCIGASSNIGIYTLPQVLGVFHNKYPNLKLQVLLDRNYVIEKSLLDYKLGIGIIESDVSDTYLKIELFRKEPLTLIVSPYHPWATKDCVEVDDLFTQPFIVGEPGSGTRRALERQIGSVANKMQIAFQLGSTEAVKKAVENSLGISIVVSSSVSRELDMNTLVAVPIRGVKFYKEYKIIYRNDKYLSECEKRFISFLHSFSNMKHP